MIINIIYNPINIQQQQ